MAARLKYGELAPEGMEKMRALEHYLNTATGLEPVLLDLVRLRVSLMNGCEYCIHLHESELRKLHEPEEQVAGVGDWRGSSAYTERERAALAWAEAVTNIQDGHADDAVYAAMQEHFSEVEAGGEFDAGDYDDQCVEPAGDCVGELFGSCGGGGEVREGVSRGLKPGSFGLTELSGLKPGPISEAKATTNANAGILRCAQNDKRKSRMTSVRAE